MFKRDERLKDFYTFVNNMQHDKYRQTVVDNPFDGLTDIIQWLVAVVKDKLLEGSGGTGDRAEIDDLIVTGNIHYASVFARAGLMPPNYAAGTPIEPLSYAVDEICDTIAGHRTSMLETPTVYTELEELMLTKVAVSLANDSNLGSLKHWTALYHLFWNSNTFYSALLDAIPEAQIRARITELSAPADHNNVLHGLGQGDRRMDDKAFHRAYLSKMEKYITASPSTYVGKLTKDADTIMLSEDHQFKKSLVDRLGLEHALLWIDGLHWPLAQAAVMHDYSDLAKIEQLIELIVARRKDLKTPFVHLLLIALERYMYLLRSISFNLVGLSAGHHHFDQALAESVEAEGLRKYNNWIATEIHDSIRQVLDTITSQIGVPDAEIHRGLFGWVANQDREKWLYNSYKEPLLLAIDTLHQHYLGIYTSGRWHKQELLTAIAADSLDWVKAAILYRLWEADESDEDLRASLLAQMVTFLKSADFNWNSGYRFEDQYIHQALHFANLLFKGKDPVTGLNALVQEARTWHEGWAYRGAMGIKNSNRYIFLLTAGVCLAYIYYKHSDKVIAGQIWQGYDDEVITQYRSTVSELDRSHYLLPLRLLAHTLVEFDSAAFENYMRKKAYQLDQIEDLIVLAHSVIETAGHLKQSIAHLLKHDIWNAIERHYWVIEARLLHAKHPDPLRQYRKLYDEVKIWHNEPPAI